MSKYQCIFYYSLHESCDRMITWAMKFVGTTVIYAYLQTVGVIYSHDGGCFLEHKTVV